MIIDDKFFHSSRIMRGLHFVLSFYSKFQLLNLDDVLSYSGDTDARVPVTSSRYSINTLKLPIQVAWRPWYSGKEVLKSVYL